MVFLASSPKRPYIFYQFAPGPLSLGASWAINRFVHANLQSEITPDWWPIALAVSVVASLMGALYPGLRAARQDAIEALSYE